MKAVSTRTGGAQIHGRECRVALVLHHRGEQPRNGALHAEGKERVLNATAHATLLDGRVVAKQPGVVRAVPKVRFRRDQLRQAHTNDIESAVRAPATLQAVGRSAHATAVVLLFFRCDFAQRHVVSASCRVGRLAHSREVDAAHVHSGVAHLRHQKRGVLSEGADLLGPRLPDEPKGRTLPHPVPLDDVTNRVEVGDGRRSADTAT